MNYISHHEVARLYDPSASREFLFGSFVTDLARMTGSRRELSLATGTGLVDGMRFHRLTNNPAFDGQALIAKLEKDMRDSFGTFLKPRTATQASRAGKDLLFDGIQFQDPLIVKELLATLRSVLDEEFTLTGIEEPAALLNAASWLHSNGVPRYDDIEVVTDRLFVVLDRTRTPLHRNELTNVRDVLAEYQPAVFAIGPAVMKETVQNLHAMNLTHTT